MTSKINRCYFQAAGAGTGDFVYDETESGFHSPVAAGATDGDSFYYIAEVLTAGVPTQWELGVGTWSTDTLTRSALESSNGGLAVDFSDPPKVRMGVPLAADFSPIVLSAGDEGEGYSVTAGSGLAGNGGAIEFAAGDGQNAGGDVVVRSGDGIGGPGGTFAISAGEGALGGSIQVTSGQGNTGKGGDIIYSPAAGATDGGDFKVTLPGAGSGRQGLAIFENLPTEDPGVSGALWSDGGVLTVSP